MFKPMTYEEILNKAKYILFESYCSNKDEKAKYDIETNKQSVIDFLKDKQYLKIGNPDSNTRYYLENNYHHYTTSFLYSNLKQMMNYIGVKDFNFNDFVLRKNIVYEQNFSYLYYVKDVRFRLVCNHYELDDNMIINYYVGKDIIECDYTFLSNARLNHCLKTFANQTIPLIPYHRLNYLAHDCGIIENLSTASDKTILISGDSHMIPFIPIISCYYKKTIVLDSRYSGDDTSYYWENENIDDVIICPSFNADISKYINKNFIS